MPSATLLPGRPRFKSATPLAPSLQSIQFWAGNSCAVGRSTLPNGISSNRLPLEIEVGTNMR